MKASATILRHGRFRLLATCSALAIACAATPARAAPTLTGDAVYTLDNVLPATDAPQASSVYFDIYPSAYSSTSSIFGHTYGYLDGTFGTRGSGTGVFNIDSFTRYENTITNATGAAAHYYVNFLIEGGEIGASMGELTGSVFGGVTANILVNGVSAFTSSASMLVTDAGMASFTTGGTVLNPGGESLATGSGSYFWNAYSGVLDLGVLADGASVSIDYKLTSLAYSTVEGCTSGGGGYGGYGGDVAAMVVVEGPGYGGGGTACYDQTAIARIGDPVDGDYQSLPGGINIAVPEPASTALLGAGLAGLAFMRRRRAAT